MKKPFVVTPKLLRGGRESWVRGARKRTKSCWSCSQSRQVHGLEVGAKGFCVSGLGRSLASSDVLDLLRLFEMHLAPAVPYSSSADIASMPCRASQLHGLHNRAEAANAENASLWFFALAKSSNVF